MVPVAIFIKYTTLLLIPAIIQACPTGHHATLLIINQLEADFPFYAPPSLICADTCVSWPKNCSNCLKQNLLSGNMNNTAGKLKISEK